MDGQFLLQAFLEMPPDIYGKTKWLDIFNKCLKNYPESISQIVMPCVKSFRLLFLDLFLIHPADLQSRPVVIIVFAQVVRTYVSKSSEKKAIFKRKQISPLARLWVWPSGSFMTPVLFIFISSFSLKIVLLHDHY